MNDARMPAALRWLHGGSLSLFATVRYDPRTLCGACRAEASGDASRSCVQNLRPFSGSSKAWNACQMRNELVNANLKEVSGRRVCRRVTEHCLPMPSQG